eukprot:14507228-Alexandrium_andersonii.AAC.1
MAFLPVALAVLPVWPAGVPVGLKDLASEMALESVDVLVHRPDSLTEAIIDQWVIEGGERAQQSVDAVLALVYALRRCELGRDAAQRQRLAEQPARWRRCAGHWRRSSRAARRHLDVEATQTPADRLMRLSASE